MVEYNARPDAGAPGSAPTSSADTTAAPQRWRRWVPTLATIAVIALCLAAAHWQRSRMQEKQALRAQFDVAAKAAPLAAHELPTDATAWRAMRYRPVALEGTFDAQRQRFLDNKVHEGRAGYDVIAPLRLADGRDVLVDRGWVVQGPSRAILPRVPPPAGEVRVRGRIDFPAAKYVELGAEAAPGLVWQHLDIARLGAALGLSLPPVVIEQTVPASGGDTLLRAWPDPDFGIATHRMYMLQWYAFAAVALGFWLATHWPRRLVRIRKASP